jgi:hypothetical protein
MYSYGHEPINLLTSTSIVMTVQRSSGWTPVALATNLGFAPAELRRVQRLVVDNRALLLEKWHERFPS